MTTQAKDRAAGVLTALLNVTRTSDAAAARVAGCTRQTISNKRKGETSLDLDEVEFWAQHFDVPVYVFLMEIEEFSRWLAEYRPKLFRSRYDWLAAQPALPLEAVPA